MAEHQYITLREKPKWMISAAQWFHSVNVNIIMHESSDFKM